MEKLVYLNRVDGVESFLERAAWSDVDGLEVDISEMSEGEYIFLKEQLLDAPVSTSSIHYERTSTISLKEWPLFKSQLEMLVERAQELGCSVLSVHPPRVEKETANTMKDLKEFVANVDAYAAAANLNVCFELTGFMKDPQLINIAFEDLETPSLGVMIDLETMIDGVDPLQILQKLDVDIYKVRFPLSIQQMEEDSTLAQSGMAVVGTSLD